MSAQRERKNEGGKSPPNPNLSLSVSYPGILAPQRRVPVVLDVVLRPSGQSSGELDPAVAAPRVRPHERGLLPLGPRRLLYVGAQLVVPALAALLAHSPGEQGRER